MKKVIRRKNNGLDFDKEGYSMKKIIMLPYEENAPYLSKMSQWTRIYPKANIDLSRIYVGGYSMGGKMTLKMAVAYPELFAAIFPICPAWTPSTDALNLIADIPVWLTSGKLDPLVNYFFSVIGLLKNIKATNNKPPFA